VDHDVTERDRQADQRETALDRREAALVVREKALAQRMESAQHILDAGDQRDAVSVARDVGAETRERHLDRARFLAQTSSAYGDDLPQRRDAAADRSHAKGNRGASHDDRIALTETPEAPDADLTGDDRP
jgi:hypothetical protein